jgi:hypothetical protein
MSNSEETLRKFKDTFEFVDDDYSFVVMIQCEDLYQDYLEDCKGFYYT